MPSFESSLFCTRFWNLNRLDGGHSKVIGGKKNNTRRKCDYLCFKWPKCILNGGVTNFFGMCRRFNHFEDTCRYTSMRTRITVHILHTQPHICMCTTVHTHSHNITSIRILLSTRSLSRSPERQNTKKSHKRHRRQV